MYRNIRLNKIKMHLLLINFVNIDLFMFIVYDYLPILITFLVFIIFFI